MDSLLNFTNESLASLDIAQALFRDLGQCTEIFLNRSADVTDRSSIEESADSNWREHEKQKASQLRRSPDLAQISKCSTEKIFLEGAIP